MNNFSPLSAALAYIPIIGWVFVLLTQRKNEFAFFHLRQSIGLVLFLISAVGVWIVVAYVLAWIPALAIMSVALFTMVIAAYLFGVVALLMGLNNALKRQATPLPLFGQWANRLPVR